MSTDQLDWSRRLVVFVLVPVLILAGLILVVWGAGTARFAWAVTGIALVVAGALALIAARPQHMDWSRRIGVSLATIGGLFFLGSLAGQGAFPSIVYLVVVVAGALLLVRQRIKPKPVPLHSEAQ